MVSTPLRTHIFTDVNELYFLKQSPGLSPQHNGVSFSFGTSVPENIDVLIVFNRASYSIATVLPKERTVFVAAEPDVIHPYSTRFLNQFGLVLSTTAKPLGTEKWQRATCWYWFAGIDFSPGLKSPFVKDHDWFATLDVPEKSDRISIVTSTKLHTEYHRKRMRFVNCLINRIPDHLDLYGRGFRSIGDKADALLANRYHLAIENGDGPHAWTEKLVDPWLCWAFPFYAGCDNVEEYFPADSFAYVNLDTPETEAERMISEIQNGRWQASMDAIAEARQKVLHQHNLMHLVSELSHAVACHQSTAPQDRRRYIWSERSLLPEKGARGSLPEWMLRNALILFDPQIELKLSGVRNRLERHRSERRARKLARLEKFR
jgi:hypothetical protein